MLDYVKERDKAFIAAVLNDDWEPVKRYCKKYDIPIPGKEIVMKAGIYKAVQECTNIPDDIKNEAAEKCVELGFSPYI